MLAMAEMVHQRAMQATAEACLSLAAQLHLARLKKTVLLVDQAVMLGGPTNCPQDNGYTAGVLGTEGMPFTSLMRDAVRASQETM
jgi:hypothetical protein